MTALTLILWIALQPAPVDPDAAHLALARDAHATKPCVFQRHWLAVAHPAVDRAFLFVAVDREEVIAPDGAVVVECYAGSVYRLDYHAHLRGVVNESRGEHGHERGPWIASRKLDVVR